MTIIEFLTARLDERERRARTAEQFVGTKYDPLVLALGQTVNASLVELYRDAAPERVLAEVAAKQRVMARHRDDGHGNCEGCGYDYGDISQRYDVDECPELRDLAAPDANHPDYNPAWRVE